MPITKGIDSAYDTKDNDLMGIANYALLLVQQNPYIKKSSEVTPTFILDLGVILFGRELLPHPNPLGPRHDLVNFNALLRRLSDEIGTELDHINAEELMLGKHQAVYYVLEILTAFISYCIEANCIEFDESNSSELDACKEVSKGSPVSETGHFNKLLENPEFQLTTSPELPRLSVSHVCPLVSTKSFNHNQTLTTNHSVLQTVDSMSDANFMENSINQSFSTVKQHNLLHPSVRSMHSFNVASPPATPTDLNGVLEIKHLKSPESNTSSLQCSPVFQTSSGCPAHRISLTSAKQSDLNSNQLKIDQSSMDTINKNENCSINLEFATCSNSLGHDPNVEITKTTATTQLPISFSSVADCESLSSGRGRSLTHTLTNTNNTSLHIHVDAVTTSEQLDKLYIDRQSNSHATSNSSIDTDCILAWSNAVTADDNADTRDSLRKRSRSVLMTDAGGSDSATTYNSSELSKSIDDDSDENHEFIANSIDNEGLDGKLNSVKNRPSALLLFNRTEKFFSTIERRLNYLRTISDRARLEAQALSDLIQLMANKNTQTVQSMQEPIPTSLKQFESKDHNLSLYQTKQSLDTIKLEQILGRLLDSVTTLNERITAKTPPNYIHNSDKCTVNRNCAINTTSAKSDDTAAGHYSSQKKYCDNCTNINCDRKQRSGLGARVTTKSSGDSSYIYDLEYQNLMKLKHECMMKAMRLCLDRMNVYSPSVPSTSGINHNRKQRFSSLPGLRLVAT